VKQENSAKKSSKDYTELTSAHRLLSERHSNNE